MTIHWEDTDRRPIPRWRTSSLALEGGELATPSVGRQSTESARQFFAEKRVAWERARNTPAAAEFVGICLVTGREIDGTHAAEFLVSKESGATPALRHVAAHLLQRADRGKDWRSGENVLGSPTAIPQTQIRSLRGVTRDDPRNALAWTDLARAYAVIGLGEKAATSMEIALKLVRGNRFVLRAGARLFLHLNDPLHALRLLRSRDATPCDPWLTAAEIAVASIAEKSSRFVKQGRGMLTADTFAPRHLTELASAIGTLELYNGKASAARKLFRQSLTDPNDNAVAQATWASRNLSGIDVSLDLLRTPRSYEARARTHYFASDWKHALADCQEWLFDEPFSSRPAELGSFIALFVLSDHTAAERLAAASLKANPNHWGLRNNLALALANLGRLPEAQAELDRIPVHQLSELPALTVRATQGFVRFRRGEVDLGRADYEWAMERAAKFGQRVATVAAIHLAAEEVRAGTVEAGSAVERMTRLAADTTDQDILLALGRVQQEMRARRTADSSP